MAITYPNNYEGPITSDILKLALTPYLVFKKQVSAVSHEFQYKMLRGHGTPLFTADVVAIKDGRLWEFEIKTSKADFLNDFKKGYYSGPEYCKHKMIADGVGPSKFWFVVSPDIVEFAKEYLDANYKKYGLMTISYNKNFGTVGMVSKKPVSSIHDNEYKGKSVEANQMYVINTLAQKLLAQILEKAKAP